MAVGGESLLLGVELEMNAQGMVVGARIADQSFQKLRKDAKQTADKVSGEMDRMMTLSKKSLVLLGAGIVANLTGKKITSFFMQGEEAARDFGVAMNNVRFVSGATGDELERIRDFLVTKGIETPFSPKEAAEGLFELNSAGLSTEQAMTGLNDTLNLVLLSAGKLTLAEGAANIATALKKFGLEADQAVVVVDQFARANQVSNFHIEELGKFLNALRAAPSMFKFQTEEAFALGGALRNVGMRPAGAGQAIAGLTRKFAQLEASKLTGRLNQSSKALAMLQDITGASIKPFDEVTGKFRGLTMVAGEIADALSKVPKQSTRVALANKLLGDQASAVITAVTELTFKEERLNEVTGEMEEVTLKGKDAFDAMTASIKDSQGVAQEATDAFLKTSEGIRKMFEGTAETIMITLGEAIAPAIDFTLKKLTALGNMFLRFAKENPKLIKVLAGVGFAFGIILTAVGSLLILIGGIGLAVAGFQIGLLTLGITLGALATTVGWVVAGVAALGALFALGFFDPLIDGATKAVEIMGIMFNVLTGEGITRGEKGLLEATGMLGFTEFLASAGAVIDNFINGVLEGFAEWSLIGDGIQGVTDIFRFFMDEILDGLAIGFEPLIEALGLTGFAADDSKSGMETFGKVVGAVARFVVDSLVLVAPIFRVIAGAVGGLIKWFVNLAIAAKDVFVGIANILGGFVGVIAGIFSDDISVMAGLEQMWDGVKQLFGGLLSGLFELVIGWMGRMAFGMIEALLGGLAEAFPSVTKWFEDSWQSVRDFFPGSDAKKGPLSDLTASGSALVTTLQGGAEQQFPSFESAVQAGLSSVRGFMGIGQTDVAGAPLLPGDISSILSAPFETAASFISSLIPGVAEQPSAPAVPGGDSPASPQVGGAGAQIMTKNVTLQIENVTVQTAEAGTEGASQLADQLFEMLKLRFEEDAEDSFFG